MPALRRLDERPPLDDPCPVPAEAIAEFAEKGHAVVRGVASAEEVEAYRPDLEATAQRLAWDTRPLAERDTYGKAFLQSANLWRADEASRRFVLSPRFAGVAAAVLGVDGVRLYHDQALVKEAGGGHTPWHQDQYYWPLDTDRTITLWMPLVDLPSEVGSMTFASGSHRMGDLRGPSISDESDEVFAAAVDELGLRTETHGSLAAGDVTLHGGWTLHSAGGNPTAADRPVMTIIYVADGARVAEPANRYQEFDRQAWLGGVEPGQPVGSELNPRLWPPEGAA